MRKFTCLLSTLLIFSQVYAQKTISLDDAIKTALQRNTILQKSVNNLNATESNLKRTYGELLPQLNVGGNWSWNRAEDKGGPASVGGGMIINLPASTQDSRSYSAYISTNWTLFDGLSNFASVSQGKNDLESARMTLKRLKQDIVFETISRFITVVNAEKLLKVKDDDLKWNKKNLETIVERNKLGAVTLADVYAQQVKVGNAELSLIQANNDLETSKSSLLNYLGMDVVEDIKLIEPVDVETISTQQGAQMLSEYENLNKMIDQAMNSRPDYVSAKLGLQSAMDGIDVAKGGYYPTLSNSNYFSMRGNKLSDIDASKNYSVGLSLNIPIFSGWNTENMVQQAQVRAENKKIEITELEKDIKISLKKTYLDFQAAYKRLEVSESNVLSAEKNRQIEQEKYNLGSGTLVNLLLANSEYTFALQNNINNKFDFYRLKSQIEYYLGVLDYKKFE